jgi:cytochrome c-type biogenesis protein CcmH/NrfF
MHLTSPRPTSNATVLRWAAITLALLAGLGEWVALLRARRRQQTAQQMTGLRQG